MRHDIAPSAADGIAIIGMTGRFPGARDVKALWQNLCTGVESLRPITAREMAADGVDVTSTGDRVMAGGIMADADLSTVRTVFQRGSRMRVSIL